RLAEQLTGELRAIIGYCARPGAGGRTPSDFPLARLDQATVDRLVGDGRTVEDVYPLTPMQAGMVFHGLVDTASTAYFNQVQVRLAIARLPDERRLAGPAQVPAHDDEVLLVWTFHHVLLDGWSAAQVFGEICEQYAALAGGRTLTPAPRRPFKDFLRWLAERDKAEAEEYWRGILAGFESPTPLPFDRPPVEAHRAASSQRVRLTLSPEASARLRDMAQRNGLTLNTVVQGAWGLVLAHFSGERDVVFGTTVSGRPADLPGVESMVGMFINTVPTRVTVHSGQPVARWLQA